MADKKTDVKYNKEVLSLINELTKINTKLLIEKEEVDKKEEPKKILIDGKNADTTIAYKFSTDIENFTFDGEEVAFYDFSEFYELFDVLETPKVVQINNDKFEIKKNKTKITYFISDSEAVGSGFSEINFQDPDFTFVVSEEQLKDLRKMITLIQADTITISIEKGQVNVKLSSGEKNNSYETQFETEDDCKEDFSVTTETDAWEKIPEGTYDIQVKSEGIVRFKYLENDKVSLDIYAAEIEED